VKIEEMEGAPKSIQALFGGSVDVVAGGYLQFLDLVAQGRPLRAFLLMQRFPGFAAIVSPRASRPIHTIAELKGMNVGGLISGE
jgi:NitT/TauT family transport system substrate-binding protein